MSFSKITNYAGILHKCWKVLFELSLQYLADRRLLLCGFLHRWGSLTRREIAETTLGFNRSHTPELQFSAYPLGGGVGDVQMDAAYLRARSTRYRAQADATDNLQSRHELLRTADRFWEIAADVDRRVAKEALSRLSCELPANQRPWPANIMARLWRQPRSNSSGTPVAASAGVVRMWSAALTAIGMMAEN